MSDEFDYAGPERRKCPLTHEQVKMFREMTEETAERAAKKAIKEAYPEFKKQMINDMSASFGKAVIQKGLVILGSVILGVWAMLAHFGFIKGGG